MISAALHGDWRLLFDSRRRHSILEGTEAGKGLDGIHDVDAQCATNDWGLGLAREPKTVYYEDTTMIWTRAHSHCRYIIDFLFNVYIHTRTPIGCCIYVGWPPTHAKTVRRSHERLWCAASRVPQSRMAANVYFNRGSSQLHSRWINYRLGKEAHQLQMMVRY